MKIKWTFDADSKLATLTLNEAYFRFEYAVYLRVDCEGDNEFNKFSKEQEYFCKELCKLWKDDSPVFKKIIFHKNYMDIILLVPWDDYLVREVDKIFEETWPEFFKVA